MQTIHLPHRIVYVPCANCGFSPCNWVIRPINQPYYASFALYPEPHQPTGPIINVNDPYQPNTTHLCSEVCAKRFATQK